MKTLNLISVLCFFLVGCFGIPDPSPSNCEDPTGKPCEICEDEYVYECVPDWIHYNLDNAPATDGVYFGDFNGNPAYIGREETEFYISPARIQINDPKGAYTPIGDVEVYVADSYYMWYLKKDPNHLLKWVSSSNSEKVPFAIEVGDCEVDDGYEKYITKVNVTGGTSIGVAVLSAGENLFVDSELGAQRSKEYLVLTCRSKVYQPEKTCICEEVPKEPSAPGSSCVHEWKPFIGDDAPERDGVSAGLHDIDDVAYVGKVWNEFYEKPGRIEINKTGVLTTSRGVNFLGTVDSSYLVNNPHYNYRWVDASFDEIILNAVTVSRPEGFFATIGRAQINGRIQIGSAAPFNDFNYPGEDGLRHTTREFQVLVCDPIPKCRCKPSWKPYKNNQAPSVDGLTFDGISYIGRAVQKLPEGFSSVIGRVDITEGVYYLNDPSGREELEAEDGEYLMKSSNSIYAWVTTHTDQRVENALELPLRCENFTTCDVECDSDGKVGFIGKATIDGVSFVGTVYKNEGLVIADSCGKKMTLSNFEVLTCVTSERCEEEERSCEGKKCGWEED